MENDSLKRCSKCKKEKLVDEFRGKNQTCNECCEKKKQYRENNQEKIKEYTNEYRQKAYTCPLCTIEIKTHRKALHEKSLGHQYYLQQFNKNEAPRKPDKIDTSGGITSYYCFACKCATSPNSWGAHCMSHID